ncbi:MAG: hypothetical protein K9J42_05150 [Sulfuritalea sp.]|nr:hypothetical protein [Sulfuritalea sp.]
MANTFYDLTIAIDLPQFALGVMFIPAMDHQIIDDDTLAGTNTKGIFGELMGLHETPFTSSESDHYMQ